MFRSYGRWPRSVIFQDHALVVHTYLLLFFPFPNGNNVRTFVDNLLKLRNKRHNSNLYQSVICISNLCLEVYNDQDKPMLCILFPPLLELRHRQVVYPNWTRDRLTIEAEAMEMLSPFWIYKKLRWPVWTSARLRHRPQGPPRCPTNDVFRRELLTRRALGTRLIKKHSQCQFGSQKTILVLK